MFGQTFLSKDASFMSPTNINSLFDAISKSVFSLFLNHATTCDTTPEKFEEFCEELLSVKETSKNLFFDKLNST
jgi:hypothetical protein